MNQKRPNSLSRILGYAGGYRKLTILGCILSALSAVLGLVPYVCVWLVARAVLVAWPGGNPNEDLGHWGWLAVWFAVGSILLYFAALMSTHIAAFRTALKYPPYSDEPCFEVAAGVFHRQSVRPPEETH